MQCFFFKSDTKIYECLILTLLDTFTEFLYKTNEKYTYFFFLKTQKFFLGRGDFGGSVEKGETNKILF
jgi:hypothetical protein